MLVKYPNKSEPAIDDRLVNTTDFLPTCLKEADIQAPECDGNPLQDNQWKRDYTFAEGEGYLAVTDGTYKYIHVQKGREHGRELLDLKADPHEFVNHIEKTEYQAVLSRLREQALEHLVPSVLA